MAIKIRDAAEFQRLLTELVDELGSAHSHFALHRDLQNSVTEYVRELNEAPAFWQLTIRAHYDATLMHLGKSFDQHNSSLNLSSLLRLVQEHAALFAEPHFRERLKGNPFVDSLAASPRRPDPARLKTDMEAVSISNPDVRNLRMWRHKYFAHRDPKQQFAPEVLAVSHPLPYTTIEALLDLGMGIMNRYLDLFIATTYGKRMFGQDDFRKVLEAVRARLQAREAEFQAELARHKLAQSD